MDGTRPDLLVVYPNNRARAYGVLATDIAAVSPPVQAGLTAAYARRDGLAVALLDAEAEGLDASGTAERIARLRPGLVSLSTDYLNSGEVTKIPAVRGTIAALARVAPGIPVLLEGVVPAAFPERMLLEERADYVCVVEPYAPVVELARHLRAGRGAAALAEAPISGIWARHGEVVVPGERTTSLENATSLPVTAWDLMPPSQYRAHHWHCFDALERRSPYAALFTNLGCPYPCTFCSVNVVAGGPNFRPRSPEGVVAELDLLVRRWGVRNVRLLDNVFTIRLDLVEELCDRIAAQGWDLNMWAYARVETIRDAAILAKMRRAGVRWLAYGIESANPEVRKGVLKPSSTTAIERALEWTRAADISMVGNFIFGLPDDDVGSMTATLDLAKDFNFEWANFYCAMAYPGTALHAEALREGWELPETWDGYSQYAADSHPLPTRHLRSADVQAFRDEAFLDYFGRPAYMRLIESRFGPDAVAYVRRILALGKPPRNMSRAVSE